MGLKILIVEDEPIIAADIELTLNQNGYLVVGVAHNYLQAIDMLHSRQPELVILDICIPGERNGIELAKLIREKYQVPFLFLTSFSDPDTLNQVKPTLPYGYLVKPFKDKDLLTSVELAFFRANSETRDHQLQDEDVNRLCSTPLTDQEFVVLQRVWKGYSNNGVSEDLDISVNTVKTHLKHIFQKLEVSSRSELLAKLR